jgi:hypothetical protein
MAERPYKTQLIDVITEMNTISKRLKTLDKLGFNLCKKFIKNSDLIISGTPTLEKVRDALIEKYGDILKSQGFNIVIEDNYVTCQETYEKVESGINFDFSYGLLTKNDKAKYNLKSVGGKIYLK